MQFSFACFGFVWFLFSLVVGFFNLSFYGWWVKAPTWGVDWLPSLDNKYKEWDTLCDWESTKGLRRSATCLWPFYIHATVHSSASLESSTPASSFVVHLPLIASSVHFLSFFSFSQCSHSVPAKRDPVVYLSQLPSVSVACMWLLMDRCRLVGTLHQLFVQAKFSICSHLLTVAGTVFAKLKIRLDFFPYCLLKSCWNFPFVANCFAKLTIERQSKK